MILAVLGVALGVGVSAGLFGGWQQRTSPIGPGLLVAGSVLGALSLFAAGLAVWPRYSTKRDPDQAVSYWGHVVTIKTNESLKDQLGASGVDPEDVYFELRVLSAIVHRKYRAVRWAMAFGMASFLFLGVFTLVP